MSRLHIFVFSCVAKNVFLIDVCPDLYRESGFQIKATVGLGLMKNTGKTTCFHQRS